MKHIRILIALIVAFSLIPSTRSAPPWLMGNRQVPGPLPPNFSAIPALDIQIGVVYGRAGLVNLLLDFAKPQLCRTQKVPLVVYVHGGWWVGGSRTGMIYTGIARALYQCGIAFASIDYRLTPAYTYKDIIADCKLAIRFLRANAAMFGIDPDKISIWGGSAGGHLVSLMGTAGDNDGLEGPGYEGISSRPSAVVNDCGIEDLTTPWDATSTTIIGWFLGCPPATCPDKAKQASPSWQASPDDPPIMTLHGDHDPVVAYSQALALNKSLSTVGNKGAFICVVNGNHGFGPYTGGVTVTPNGTRQAWLRFYHLIRYIEPGALCDLNIDGMVNSTDSAELDSLMGTFGINAGGLPTTPLWNTQADIYSDGRINYKDWQTFSSVKAVPPKFTLEIIPSTQDIGNVRILIKNLGQLDIHNYKVTLNAPSQLVLKSSSETLSVNGQTITFTGALLPAWQTKTIDLVFKTTSNSPPQEKALQLTLKSELSAPEDILPIQATAKIALPTLTLWLGSSIMRIKPGDKTTLTAIARNPSQASVKFARLWINLPKELALLSSMPKGAVIGSRIFFDIGTMAPGSSAVFKVIAQAANGLGGGSLLVSAGLASDQTYDQSESSVLIIANDIPGSNPEINIKWAGLDTKASTGKAGSEINAELAVTKGTSPYEIKFSWGDGAVVTANMTGSEPRQFKHTYPQPGRYEISIICTDSVMRQKMARRVVEIR